MKRQLTHEFHNGTMPPVLEFAAVARSFVEGKPVLDGVSLSLERDEVLALIGRNGAGKTTLIQIALGMLLPHAGTVRVFGLSPADKPVAVKKRIGFVAKIRCSLQECALRSCSRFIATCFRIGIELLEGAVLLIYTMLLCFFLGLQWLPGVNLNSWKAASATLVWMLIPMAVLAFDFKYARPRQAVSPLLRMWLIHISAALPGHATLPLFGAASIVFATYRAVEWQFSKWDAPLVVRSTSARQSS